MPYVDSTCSNVYGLQQPCRNYVRTWSCCSRKRIRHHQFCHHESYSVHLPVRLRHRAHDHRSLVGTVWTFGDLSHLQHRVHWLHHRMRPRYKYWHVHCIPFACWMCRFWPVDCRRWHRCRRDTACSAWKSHVAVLSRPAFGTSKCLSSYPLYQRVLTTLLGSGTDHWWIRNGIDWLAMDILDHHNPS